MEKHLHVTISNQQTSPIETMQEIRMEQDFANELAVLKTIQLEPRNVLLCNHLKQLFNCFFAGF